MVLYGYGNGKTVPDAQYWYQVDMLTEKIINLKFTAMH